MKAILKKTMVMAVAALSLGFVACDNNDFEVNYNIKPGDVLYTPAANSSINLDQGLNTVFEWAPAVAEDGGYVTYDVIFDKEDGDFSQPVAVKTSQLTGSKASLSMTAKDFNDIAAKAGIENAKTGKLKWTVRVGKGLNAQIYAEANVLTITRINLVDPLPTTLTLKGAALETPEGINLQQGYLDGKSLGLGVFECFTKISAGEFTISDELDRYYNLKSATKIRHIVDGSSTANTLEPGIYWIRVDLTGMTYSAQKIAKIEYYAAAWTGGQMKTDRTPLTYKGKGVWELLNYANKTSDNVDKDSRHRFDMIMDNGDTWFLGTMAALGAAYTTDYWRVNVYTWNKDDKDWNKTYKFLNSDCGRPFDCYLYLNADNKAGGLWHEYIFK